MSTIYARSVPPRFLVLAAFGAVYLIWGSTFLGIRIAIESFPPLLMAGCRFFMAGTILFVILKIFGEKTPGYTYWFHAAVLGGLLIFAGNGIMSAAQVTVPSSLASLIIAVIPLWMILIDWIRPGGVRPKWTVFVGLLLGFAGVTLIVLSRDAGGNSLVDPKGAIMLMAASIFWAIGSVGSRYARLPENPLMAVAMQMIAGGLITVLVGIMTGETGQLFFEKVTLKSMIAFFYLSIFGSLVGFTAYTWLLRVSTPTRVSTYAYVNPLIAVLLGWKIAGEQLTMGIAFAGALIIGAVMLITIQKARAREAVPE